MERVRTARDMFYFVEDVMAMLGYSKSKSYKIIASLNRELVESGVCVCVGRNNKRYFYKRFVFTDQEPAKAARRVSA